jgi:SAM-dependent methyltransferase
VAAIPQTWHYGLIARWWAEFNVGGEEIPYLSDLILQEGGRALDVGCGTGRVLVPLMEAGLDVDGADLSPDMLEYCRGSAERAGYTPLIKAQPTHELDMGREYPVVYSCGTFALGGDRQQDIEGLRRCREHLHPGGVFVFDSELPNHEHFNWLLGAGTAPLEEPWPTEGTRKRTADGTDLELICRTVDCNAFEATRTLAMRVNHTRDGKLLAKEEHTLKLTLYLRNEILLMLQHVGFGDVEVRGGWSDRAPVAGEDGNLLYVARN